MDGDGDGLPDACEQALAERFAPVVYHSSDESNFPTDVDDFLGRTRLGFHDDACDGETSFPIQRAPDQHDLLNARTAPPCSGAAAVSSSGSRSAGKHLTYFLADVDEEDRKGSLDPSKWTTYFHAYPNDAGGVTLQYWRLYAYNDATNDHGGDWEGVHVVLDAGLGVRRVKFLQHDALAEPPLSRLGFEGEHVRVFPEGGGHASRFSGGAVAARGCASRTRRCVVDLDDPATFIRQETWTGGAVRGAFLSGTTGRLVNLGEKMAPLHGQLFVRYSGLWGSPGVFYATSGFWGPAYNETSMRSDGFVTAWCDGMASPFAREECFARDTTR